MPRPLASDVRWVALQTLLLTDRNIPVQRALDAQVRCVAFSVKDRALVAELVYGVLRTRIALDAELATVLANPRKLPVAIRHILAVGLYSLRYAERIPPHAALDTAVTLARRVAGQRMGNLVNACLRKLSGSSSTSCVKGNCLHKKTGLRSPGKLSEELIAVGQKDAWATLATEFALPSPIVTLWRQAYGGAQTIQLMRRSFARPWTGVRVNAGAKQGKAVMDVLDALTYDSSACERIGQWGFAFAPGATPQGVAGQSLAQWQAQGVLSFQAAGSQLVMERLGVYALEGPFWDCCCGVGGKSLALLERGIAVSLCSDTSARRLRQFGRDCERLGIVSPETMEADASSFTPARFDGNILVDVPCSSMGVLARRPDVKKRDFGAESLNHFVRAQRAILENVVRCVRPSRHIVYLTCTLNPDENEGQISSFLNRHSDFVLLAQWQTSHEHPWMEGMFGVLLRRGSA